LSLVGRRAAVWRCAGRIPHWYRRGCRDLLGIKFLYGRVAKEAVSQTRGMAHQILNRERMLGGHRKFGWIGLGVGFIVGGDLASCGRYFPTGSLSVNLASSNNVIAATMVIGLLIE
jgi:hypothetical protein